MDGLFKKIQYIAKWLKWFASLIDAVITFYKNNPIPKNE